MEVSDNTFRGSAAEFEGYIILRDIEKAKLAGLNRIDDIIIYEETFNTLRELGYDINVNIYSIGHYIITWKEV